jgi:hypothetical protein
VTLAAEAGPAIPAGLGDQALQSVDNRERRKFGNSVVAVDDPIERR